ncbi:PEP-CTERM sorting domain-containing protein [Roseibacillus persicicus]|uniref:Ice-binding protein C-terminal domain-containing protein n=1 Tax=Roseibacillus persicicus TaxID=454148 RepID=A0A918WJW4_9BACT|nr:PEP-CTERM sorting domain-containing protein [Roseibacillus persicicus]GHC52555.1 hypothetical protein GCM10007100_18590 [Roseibacillus persicicus]
MKILKNLHKKPDNSWLLASTTLATAAMLGSASGAVVVSATEPSTDIITSFNPNGNINSNLFPLTGTAPSPIVGNNNHARGEFFSLPDGTGTGFEITAISIVKSGNQTFSSDTITLFVFEGTETEFTTGTGHTVASSSFYEGTTVTPLYSEAFTVDGLISNDSFVTFVLNTPILVNESSDFGFFLTYDPSLGTNPDRFGYSENQNVGGQRFSITTTAHGGVGTRGMDFYITGTAIPEPSSLALLALGGFAFARRRR